MDTPHIQRGEAELDGAGGIRLHRRFWRHVEPRAALLVVHGYAEHSARYEALGQWFAARGFAVHAYDHRGHGRSGGRTCHVDRFDEFLDDLARMLAVVREAEPGRPVFLVGHSMGGLITCAFLLERHPDISGAITSGAALAMPDAFPRWRAVAARILRRLVPRLALPSGLDPSGVSRDPAVVRAYLEDPLVHSTMTTSLAMELMHALKRTSEGGGAELRVPVLMLHGADDKLVDAEGTCRFAKTLTVPGSESRIYPNLYHEIFNEPEQERVFADALVWLEERLTP